MTSLTSFGNVNSSPFQNGLSSTGGTSDTNSVQDDTSSVTIDGTSTNFTDTTAYSDFGRLTGLSQPISAADVAVGAAEVSAFVRQILSQDNAYSSEGLSAEAKAQLAVIEQYALQLQSESTEEQQVQNQEDSDESSLGNNQLGISQNQSTISRDSVVIAGDNATIADNPKNTNLISDAQTQITALQSQDTTLTSQDNALSMQDASLQTKISSENLTLQQDQSEISSTASALSASIANSDSQVKEFLTPTDFNANDTGSIDISSSIAGMVSSSDKSDIGTFHASESSQLVFNALAIIAAVGSLGLTLPQNSNAPPQAVNPSSAA